MEWFEDIETRIVEWLGSSDTLRLVSDELRADYPIAVVGKYALVSRYDDVIETLANDRAFGVTEVYADKMSRTTGDFFLGMEQTPRYEREVSLARSAVRPGDLATIRDLARTRAAELLQAAEARGGSFDAVAEFTRLIPLRIIEQYFGVPGPDPETTKRWLRILFWEIFLNPANSQSVRARAIEAGTEFGKYLDELLEARKGLVAQRGAAPNDFLGRLLSAQANDASIDDDLVRREIGGIVVGALDTQSKAMAHIIDRLLRMPEALERARHSALTDDDATLSACLWEALRFNPHNPLLFRHCHADTVLAEGTSRRALIPKGTTVVPLTISAMFDPEAFANPNEFRTDRDEARYLHFGYGQHRCFGAHMNGAVIPAALKQLLTRSNLRYAEGGSGTIAYEGPFPDKMMLQFDPPD